MPEFANGAGALEANRALYENGKKDNTIQWCRAALHDIFANAGHQNIGKLERDE